MQESFQKNFERSPLICYLLKFPKIFENFCQFFRELSKNFFCVVPSKLFIKMSCWLTSFSSFLIHLSKVWSTQRSSIKMLITKGIISTIRPRKKLIWRIWNLISLLIYENHRARLTSSKTGTLKILPRAFRSRLWSRNYFYGLLFSKILLRIS